MAGLIDYGIIKPEIGVETAQSFQRAEAQRNALAQQEQQRKLGDLQIANALREQRMAGEEEAAYKAAGNNLANLQTELMQRGLGKQAIAVGSQLQQQQANKVKMLKDMTELMKTEAGAIFANPTLENAVARVQSFGQRTGQDVSSTMQEVLALGNDPVKLKQWAAGLSMTADKLLPKFEQINAGGQVITGAFNPVTGAFEQGTTIKKTATPGEIMLDARARQQLAQGAAQVNAVPVAVVDPTTGKPVYVSRGEAIERRMTPAAAQESLPPKEIQKREAAFPQATQSVKSFESNSENFVRDLERLRDHPGLSSITGVLYGRTPSVTSEGRAAQALYDKVVAKGGFQVLQDMRNASKTGGALGNVSDREGAQLKSAFAAIDRVQDAKDVRKAIDDAIATIKGSQSRMREAYDTTYEYKFGNAPASEAKPASNVDALLDKYK